MTTQKTNQTKTIDNNSYTRSIALDNSRADEEKRTVEIAFSSEAEYSRWFGTEVLDHGSQSVRLDRLRDGGAVLVDHDSRDQVGVVEEAKIDGDRVGRATIRFSKSQRGEEIFQDVLDGIRTKVSVAYRVYKYEVEERDGQADLYRMTDWEPYEVSIVAIPADASVGVGRSENFETEDNPRGNIMSEEITEVEETQTRAAAPAVDENKVRSAATRAERERVNEISRLADSHNFADLGRQAIEEGTPLDQFNRELLEKVGERNNKARVETEHDGNVDLSRNDQNKYSFVRLMDALSNPNDRSAQKRAAFELEVSDAAAKGFGEEFVVRGSYIPESVLNHGQRDLSAGAPAAGGNLVGTTLAAGSFVDVLRNAQRTQQAGVQMLPGLVGNVDIPRQVSASTMGWIATEDGDAGESEPAFDQISLTPKDAAVYTEVTRRLLQQSTPAVDMLVRNDLAEAIGLGLDLAVHYGSGAGGQPTGIANTTGINVLDLVSAQPTYAEICAIIKLVMEDNALLGMPHWFIEANGWEALSTTPKQGAGVEGNFILGDQDRIKGYPYFNTNQISTDHYFFGDYSQVVMGEWGGLELNVDPYTHSLKGRIRYVTFKTCDLAIRRPQAFCHAHSGIA